MHPRLPAFPILLLTLFMTLLMTARPVAGAMPGFVLRPISSGEPDFYRETLLPADIDKDGDMDFFSGSGRYYSSWWFENDHGNWLRRPVSDSNLADVGAAMLDVDGDGWMDKVSASYWYRNPGFPSGAAGSAKDKPFRTCFYGNIPYVHDLYAADMDGDGHEDILTLDYGGIRWFKVERDTACRPWTEHMVNGRAEMPQHGGIAAGDLDGDGDMDIARIDRWFENRDGGGTDWLEHVNIDFGTYSPDNWGLSGRALIRDVDGDGTLDIVQSECDLPNGRVAWFANIGGKGMAWQRHLIKDSTDGQDYHSLIWSDFDDDGDADLFSSGGPLSAAPRAYVWENLDGKGGAWREHIVNSGRQEHDAAGADMDGDGDIDILVKIWGDGVQYYLQNQLVPNSGNQIREGSARGKKPTSKRSPNLKTGLFRHGNHEHDAEGRRSNRSH